MPFSENLRTLRKQHKLSQAALSNALNISQNQISKYEKGIDMPGGDIFLKIADYFNVSAKYLLDNEKRNYQSFDKKIAGQRIKYLRIKYNLRQDELANIIGISSQLLSNIETGYRNVTLDITINICMYFNVTTDYVLGLSETPHN